MDYERKSEIIFFLPSINKLSIEINKLQINTIYAVCVNAERLDGGFLEINIPPLVQTGWPKREEVIHSLRRWHTLLHG